MGDRTENGVQAKIIRHPDLWLKQGRTRAILGGGWSLLRLKA